MIARVRSMVSVESRIPLPHAHPSGVSVYKDSWVGQVNEVCRCNPPGRSLWDRPSRADWKLGNELDYLSLLKKLFFFFKDD